MVKKVLSITLVVLMLMSLMCVNVFAAEKNVEVPVFVQSFESTTSDNIISGSYPSSHCAGGGNYAVIKIKSDNGNNYLELTAKNLIEGSISVTNGRARVYIDQSVLESGATYKLYATVKYVSTDSSSTQVEALFGTMKNNDSATRPGNRTGTIYLQKDVSTVVESKEFTYDTSVFTTSMDALLMWKPNSATAGVDTVLLDDVRLVKVVTIADADDNFTTDVDAGYYADAPDADEKEGIIIFGAETIDGINEASKYGMWIYRENGEEEKVILESGDITTYKNEDGKFFATVTNIPSENFDDIVIAKPYIVVGDETIWGQTINYTVNQGNKWLGTK